MVLEELLEKTKEYRWISFDLFDTLMFRAVSKPTLIFDLVEREYNNRNSKWISGFGKRRIKAEALARKQARYKEITIDKIYSNLNYTQEVREQLELLEKEIEVNTCYANNTTTEFLNQCRMRGQKIAITTDMYLDRETIDGILQHIGVEYDRLFISGELGQTKLSGELFETVLKELQIKPEQICHIGDNPKTDIQSPLKYGIQSYERLICKNGIELYENEKRTIDTDLLNTFVRSHLNQTANKTDEAAARIGYSVIGPLLYEFCGWIHNTAKKKGIKKIAFVAREGYLIKQVYDAMYPEEPENTKYIRLNKNMIRLPSLSQNPSVEQFLDTIPYRKIYTCEELAQLLFMDSVAFRNLLSENGYSDESVLRSDMTKQAFKDSFETVLQNEKYRLQEQYNLFFEYIKQIGATNEKVMLVNNSVNGSAQRSINKLIENHFLGVQFTASEKCLQELGNSVKAWLREIGSTAYERQMFAQYSIVLEHLMFEPAGTAQYLYKSEGTIDVQCEAIGAESENASVVQMIQKHALQFVKDWKRNGHAEFLTEGACFHHYMDFLLSPLKEDASVIGNLVDSDYDGIHRLFDVQPNETLGYAAAKDYRKIKWQHGYFITMQNGEALNKRFDIEKRVKCFAKNILGVSVVIVNYNGWNDTIACIDSLRRVTTPNTFVIVVDNGSTDDSPEKLKEYVKLGQECLICLENNLGFSGGNNVGIQYAIEKGAEFVCLLNNDTVVEPDFLDKMLDKITYDSVVYGKIKFYQNQQKIWFAGGHYNRWTGKTVHYGYNQEDNKQIHDTSNGNFVTGCLLLIPVSVIEQVGLLPEHYFLYYEDTEYSLRLSEYGIKMNYAPDTVIYHKVSASTKKTPDMTLYYSIRNSLLLVSEHEKGLRKWCAYGCITARNIKRMIKGSYRCRVVKSAYMDWIRGNYDKKIGGI